MKKKIKILDIYRKIRQVWCINPQTKVKNSDKIYNREKSKQQFRKRLKDEL